jgi:hypothetical protein
MEKHNFLVCPNAHYCLRQGRQHGHVTSVLVSAHQMFTLGISLMSVVFTGRTRTPSATVMPVYKVLEMQNVALSGNTTFLCYLHIQLSCRFDVCRATNIADTEEIHTELKIYSVVAQAV